MFHAAVLGHPIGHTLSPVLHRAAYAQLGLTDWSYDRFDLTEPELADFVAGLDGSWRGLSLTMPLKEVAFEVASVVSPLARTVGAINTLVRREDGWHGDNTDVHGVAEAIRAGGTQDVSRVLCLGAGATARSSLAAVAALGADEVTFATRAGARRESVAYAESLDLLVADVPLASVAEQIETHDFVVNTLPGDSAEPIAAGLTAEGIREAGSPGFFDVIYEGWPTALACVFIAGGSPVSSGLDMLIHQAAAQVELMTGQAPQVAVMAAAVGR